MSLQGRPVTVLQVEEAIAGAALSPGEVHQLPDGRAAIVQGTQAVANGATYSAITRGDIEVLTASGTTFAVGQDIQWDTATDLAVAAGGDGDFRIGVVKIAKTSGQTVTRIALNEEKLEMPGDQVYHTRQRFTIAQVNAGATILAAEAATSFRLVDVSLIAIGGAVQTATTVDILATQSAGSVKLLAAAVAGLTQNTLLRAGAANAAILAAGASFVANDANTAITIGKTGSDAATATHVDVLLSYVKTSA